MTTSEWIAFWTAVANSVSAIGVIFAFRQLLIMKSTSTSDFENDYAREYRNLLQYIPAVAVLDHKLPLPDEEYSKAFEALFRYFDLSNEQVFLRNQKRISYETWVSWCGGIQSNLKLATFKKAWEEIKSRSISFSELRRLEAEDFKIDPAIWK